MLKSAEVNAQHFELFRKHLKEIGKVDILILGIASRMDYNTIRETLAALEPQYVLPTHYDNFFLGFNEFQKFPEKLKVLGIDFSRFEQFVRSFDRSYVTPARKLHGSKGGSFDPKLRLMKLFYYYSLVNLL